jgi:hypothetical protein
MLDREHDLGLDRVEVGCGVADEVILGDPSESSAGRDDQVAGL